jgi:hypothetical protein
MDVKRYPDPSHPSEGDGPPMIDQGLAVIGADLFRVGLHLKSESRANTRRARQFIALGVAFGLAAVLILVFEAMKLFAV